MKFRVLVIGDIVGKPGRRVVTEMLPEIRADRDVDFVIANGENAAGGSGITPSIVNDLLEAGVDVITMGDHVYRKKEVFDAFDATDRLLRPANLPAEAAGPGHVVVQCPSGPSVAVANLLGRTYMKPVDCPFHAIDRVLADIGDDVDLIFVDFHAEATSDKIAMGWYLDGRVTGVCGTHTHVQTSDGRVLPGGTAYITDLGMTGPHDSILGRDKAIVLATVINGMPARFSVAKDDCRLQGVIVTADTNPRLAIDIETLSISVKLDEWPESSG
ncbi:MAG: TIGR00282 family metallophosphoesterase [Planctomycetia bacterium]|nr:TIGR00282 family metallophosphoesterase [Planctomycetia bacterium]